MTLPKRFRAQIDSGSLCFRESCVKLLIEGQGIFELEYIGERLRILQNLNGSGARGIQVRQ